MSISEIFVAVANI